MAATLQWPLRIRGKSCTAATPLSAPRNDRPVLRLASTPVYFRKPNWFPPATRGAAASHYRPFAGNPGAASLDVMETSTDKIEETKASVEAVSEKAQILPFEWKSNWYAAAAAVNLDPTRPHAVEVLGRKMVFWKDPHSNGDATAWRCFLDSCPHRLVPLSEGRIDEAGLLQCSYHGWTFGGDGSCRNIPQAANTGPEHAAIKSPRACAVSFPVREELGVLFVWPDEGPEAAARAAATPVPRPKGLTPDFVLGSYSRELMYGYEMLAENVTDPSHLPFSHHGVGPLKRSMGQPFPHISVISEREGAGGFVGRLNEEGRGSFGPVHFQAPGLFVYHRRLKGKQEPYAEARRAQDSAELTMEEVEAGRAGESHVTGLYITPVAPGRSRLITVEGNNGAKRSLLFSWMVTQHWPGHLFMHQVLDGDSFFLHAQEKAILALPSSAGNGAPTTTARDGVKHPAEGAADAALASYFMPTGADRFVIAFRKWLDRYAGGAVQWPTDYEGEQLSPDWAPKRQVLDRYSSHTAQCTHCLRALSGFRLARSLLLALSATLLLATAVSRVGLAARAAFLGAAALAGFAGSKLSAVIALFVYTGYDHPSQK